MRIPDAVIGEIEIAMEGLNYGEIRLEIKVRNGRPRFKVIRESFFELIYETDGPDQEGGGI